MYVFVFRNGNNEKYCSSSVLALLYRKLALYFYNFDSTESLVRLGFHKPKRIAHDKQTKQQNQICCNSGPTIKQISTNSGTRTDAKQHKTKHTMSPGCNLQLFLARLEDNRLSRLSYHPQQPLLQNLN